MLTQQRDALQRIEARTLPTPNSKDSLQPSLARFATRVSKLSGRVDRAAVERILETAAKAITDLEVSNEQ